MAKARIVYVVDDKELVALRKKLKALGPEADKSLKEWEKGLDEVDKKQKKTSKSLVDLKSTIAGLGIAGLLAAGVKAFVDLNAEINKSRKEVALLTSETGAALDNLTAKLRATSQVFDKDFNEILRTANTLSQEFNISMTDALDEINEGFARGLDINGEYLETLREYSTFIKEAGLSTRQFNVLIQKQVTEGIFSDKGIDAIKEALISIRDIQPATSEALEAIGIDSKKLIADIQSGTRTYFDAIQEISKKTREETDPTKVGAILADVFRGAGEDAGDYILTLDEVGEAFKDVTEEQQKYIDNQKLLLKASEELQEELVALTGNFAGLGVSLEILAKSTAVSALQSINDLVLVLRGFSPEMEKSIGAFVGKFNDARKAMKDFNASLRELSSEELKTELAKLNKELQNINDELDPTKHAFPLTEDEIKELNKELEVTNQKIESVGRAQVAAQDEINKKLALEKKARQDIIDAQNEEVRLAEEKVQAQKDASTEALKELGDIEGKGIDPLDLQSKIADRTKEIEQKLQDDLLTIREDARVKDNEAQELKAETDAEGRELRNEQLIGAALLVADQIASIQAQFAQRRIAEIDQELNALEFARNRELEIAEGNAQREAEINAKFDLQKRALQNEQLKKEKEAAVFAIAINTARGVVAALTSVPPNVPLSIAIGVIGLAQAGIVLGKKVPEFAEGILNFQGKGSTTSDSNLVKISDKESIISARNTNDYYPALKAIHNREIAPEVLNNLVMNQDTRPSTVVYDYEKLAKAVMNQPQNTIKADEDGFTQYLVRKGLQIQKKQSKYKM